DETDERHHHALVAHRQQNADGRERHVHDAEQEDDDRPERATEESVYVQPSSRYGFVQRGREYHAIGVRDIRRDCGTTLIRWRLGGRRGAEHRGSEHVRQLSLAGGGWRG